MWKQTFNDYPNNFTSACKSTIAASTQRSEILKNIKGLTRKNNLTGFPFKDEESQKCYKCVAHA